MFVRLLSEFVLTRDEQRAADAHRCSTSTAIAVFALSSIVACVLLAAQRAPLSYYAYAMFPIAFWSDAVLRHGGVWLAAQRRVRGALLGGVAGAAVLLECMVFGYFHRSTFGGVLLLTSVALLLRREHADDGRRTRARSENESKRVIQWLKRCD